MPYHQGIISLNGGEYSPFMDARIDLAKYSTGNQVLENFLITPYGALIRRPGTEFLGEAKYPYLKCRLWGFNFSTTTTFVLEFGELYCRFWSNGFQVRKSEAPPWTTATDYNVGDYAKLLVGNLIYYCVAAHTSGVFATDLAAGRWVQQDILEVPTPYHVEDLWDLQFQPINDLIYIVHPNVHPMILTRLADNDWTLRYVEWDFPPTLPENITSIRISSSAIAEGDTTILTATSGIFQAGHVGSWWTLAHRRSGEDESFVEVELNDDDHISSGLRVLGSWEFTTFGTWSGMVAIYRQVLGTGIWEPIRTYNANIVGQRNISAIGNEEREAILRIAFQTNGDIGTDGMARLELGESKYYGIVQIIEFTNSTTVTAIVKKSIWSTNQTMFWSEGAYSGVQGFPRAICWHQLRLMFGGTKRAPLSVFGSVVDDFQNFRLGSDADDAISFTISSRESSPIQWMCPQKKVIVIGTASGELQLGGEDDTQAMGPTNVESHNESSHGSAHVQAMLVGEVIMFIQRQGKKIREYSFDFTKDGWMGPDLTILANHIAGPGSRFIEFCFQQQPDATLWLPISSGNYLAGMTYEREQNVVGWHRHTTYAGVFESCANVFGGTGSDEVWLAVHRNINGIDKRYIERFQPDHRTAVEMEDKLNFWYLDCAVRRTFASPTTLITGLSHLEGHTVSVMVDGAAQPDRRVVGGQITLENRGSNVLVGLAYNSVAKPQKFNLNSRDGTIIGRPARVHRACFRLYKSLGLEFSSNGEWDQWTQVEFRKDGDPMDESPPMFTGDKVIAVDGPYQPAGELWFRNAGPFPLNILAVVPEFDFHGT